MQHFYQGLQDGLSIDHALRRAQLALIRGQTEEGRMAEGAPDPSHPFSWAGFQLIGDWY
jgi:CHAT domain-containing protein